MMSFSIMDILITLLSLIAAVAGLYYAKNHPQKSVLIILSVAFWLVLLAYISPILGYFIIGLFIQEYEALETFIHNIENIASILIILSYLLIVASVFKLGRSKKGV